MDNDGGPVIKADTIAIVSPTDETTPRLHPAITVDEQGRVTGIVFDVDTAPTTVTVVAKSFTLNGVEVTPEEFRGFLEANKVLSEIASSL